MKTISKPLSIILLMFICNSCTKNLREYRTGNENAPYRMLIAATVSDFKSDVIEGLVLKYYKTCHIKVINLSTLKYVTSSEYDVIVLIDRALAWTMFNFSVRRFIDTIDNRDKVVLFLSAGKTNWKLQVNDVDGITEASKSEKVDSVVERLSVKIDERLKMSTVHNDYGKDI